MHPSIININNLSEEEVNDFVLKFLLLLKDGVSDKKEDLYNVLNEKISEINSSHKRKEMLNDSFKKIKKKEHKNNIIEGLFELISFFEYEEEYEACAMLKKTKDNFLMDF